MEMKKENMKFTAKAAAREIWGTEASEWLRQISILKTSLQLQD